MYYPVVALIQRPPPFVLGRTRACQTLLWECYFPSHTCSKTEGDEIQTPNEKAAVQIQICNALGEGPFINLTFELQVVVRFG